MSSYVVLARKWRPAQFSDIVGQGHIVRTLMNAIRSERIHQAYLMTGSRGIGKTSIARIFAKAVRCSSATWTGDWLRSCGECPSCKEIASGNSVDVIEIDGASNNGVDAVREIRENAKYLPASGSRKIYIIDEVHMLTTAAFNALLKTLEEPPAHVIFIFATTEPHKIPATILSRCQRFDLRRVTMAQIQTRLAEVTRAEGIQAEPGALALVARAAEGSMRDALSLLDQVIAFSGNQITTQSARESVGLIEGQTLLGILTGTLARKPLEALSHVEAAYQQGHDLRVLTRSLIEFLHATILAKLGAANSATLELSEDEWKELQKLSELRELEELEMMFQVLHYGVDWIARSPQPKLVLDVLLVKCATAESLMFVRDSESKQEPDAGGTPSRKPAAGVSPAPSVDKGKAAAAPVDSNQALPSEPTPSFAALVAGLKSGAVSQAVAPAPKASVKPAAPTAGPSFAELLAAATPTQEEALSGGLKPNPAAPGLEAVRVPQIAQAPRAPQARGPISWENFIGHVRQTRPLLATLLEHGSSDTLPSTSDPEADILGICFNPEDAYFREQLQSRTYSEQLAGLAKEYFGRHVRVQIELKQGGESLAARRERQLKEREVAAREAAQNHPIIREARALFGGELGPIELTLDGLDTEGVPRHANA